MTNFAFWNFTCHGAWFIRVGDKSLGWFHGGFGIIVCASLYHFPLLGGTCCFRYCGVWVCGCVSRSPPWAEPRSRRVRAGWTTTRCPCGPSSTIWCWPSGASGRDVGQLFFIIISFSSQRGSSGLTSHLYRVFASGRASILFEHLIAQRSADARPWKEIRVVGDPLFPTVLRWG